jgi:hypothetical protein
LRRSSCVSENLGTIKLMQLSRAKVQPNMHPQFLLFFFVCCRRRSPSPPMCFERVSLPRRMLCLSLDTKGLHYGIILTIVSITKEIKESLSSQDLSLLLAWILHESGCRVRPGSLGNGSLRTNLQPDSRYSRTHAHDVEDNKYIPVVPGSF